MTTTSISFWHPTNTRLVYGPTVEDAEAFAHFLKTNYTTPEQINALLDGGDISQLGETVETTVFTGEPARVYTTLDIAETQIIPNDINFIYLETRWTRRSSVEDGYNPF